MTENNTQADGCLSRLTAELGTIMKIEKATDANGILVGFRFTDKRDGTTSLLFAGDISALRVGDKFIDGLGFTGKLTYINVIG